MKNSKKIVTWGVTFFPVFFSLFLLGGVYSHKGSNLTIMALTCFLTVVYFALILLQKKEVYISPVFIPFLLIILYASLQLIPVGLNLLGFLSPTAAFFRGIGTERSGPLTMSIPDTYYSILRIGTLLLFSYAVTNIIHGKDKNWKRRIFLTIILLSTWSILAAFVLRIVDADSWLYGNLYKHNFLMDPMIINPNHAAGFFGISAFLILAVIYKTEISRLRFFYGSLFFLHCIAVISTLSRAGITSFLTALILLTILNRFSSGHFLKHKTLIYFLAFSFITILYSGHSFLLKEFDFKEEGYFNKIANITEVSPYIGDFALTGSGLGSFSRVFTYYQSDPETRFTQLENEPLQFILETGFPFALIIFGIFLWLTLKKRTAVPHYGEKNSLTALLYFVIAHNLLDFNLHNFSILFPVTIVLVTILEPVSLKGHKRTFVLALSIISASAVIFASVYGPSQSIAGYEQDIEYEKAVYHYPSDYSIPLIEGIKKLNSEKREEFYSAGAYISSAVTKSPRYYYSHFVAGSYMLRIGSQDQAIAFYKKSAELSGKKLSFVLENIYRQLKNKNIESRIIEIIPYKIENREQIEKFLRTTKYNKNVHSKIIDHKKDIFFISHIRNMIKNGNINEVSDFINEIENSGIEISENERGRILMFKGDIAIKNKLYKDAFDLYLKGASITGDFNGYIQAGRAAFRCGDRDIHTIENKMREQSFLSKNNMAGYQKWLSEKEFRQNSFAKGIEHLNKAIDLNPAPGWIFELYRHYSSKKMYFEAKKTLEFLRKQHPGYRKENIENLLEKETRKISEKKDSAYKEKLLGR